MLTQFRISIGMDWDVKGIGEEIQMKKLMAISYQAKLNKRSVT